MGLAALAIAMGGCSAEARKTRTLEHAKQLMQAGNFDNAEVEFLNVLKADGRNADAIAGLGMMYFDQGRTGRMLPYLVKGKELQPENLELRMRLGKCFLAVGRFDDARAEALYIIQRQPQMEDAPVLLAAAAIRPADVEEARQQLLALPEAAKNTVGVIVALGTLDIRQGKTQDGEAAFKRAETLDPKSGTALSAVAGLYWSKNDLPNADRSFAAAAQQSPPRSSRRLQYGQYKMKTNDLAGARRVFDEMIKQTPDYIPAYMGLVEVATLEKNYHEATTTLAKVLSRDAVHPDAMLMNARLMLAKGENAKAVTELEKIVRTYPQSAPAHHLLGNAYSVSGDTDKAMQSFRQATTIAPGFTDAIIAIAGLNIRKGDFNAAVGPLRAIIQQRPDLVPAKVLLADAYRGMGNLEEALAVYRQLGDSAPQVPETSMLIGMVLLQQNKLAEARAAFEKALQASPNYLPGNEQLVELDLRENKPQAALERINTLALRNPKAAGPQMLLAKIYLLQKDTARAEAALLKAIELEPATQPAYFLLARLYVDAGELPKALARLQSVLDKNPKDPAALMLTGVISDQQKNYPAARDAYEKMLAVSPDSVAALNNLAYLYSEQFNQLDKALELAQKARDLMPTQPHTADTLGWILYKRKQYARAAPLLQEAADKLPTAGAVQYHLGMTRYMLGEETAARTSLQTALNVEKDFIGFADARQALDMLTLDPETQPVQARPVLEKALEARPDDPLIQTRLAIAYERTNSPDKAAPLYEKALKTSPSNVKASLGLIRSYTARGELAKAIEVAKNARKFATDDAELAYTTGKLAYQDGDSTWATGLLQEASIKLSDKPEVLADLGVAAYTVGRASDAQSAFQRFLQLAPNSPRAAEARAYLELIPASTGAEPPAGVAAKAEQALKTDPNHAAALMVQARNLELKGDRTAARAAYEKALARYRDFTLAKKQLAILYTADPRDNDKAYELALKAREAFPEDAEVGKAFGISLYRKKEYPRAAAALQNAAAKRPNDAELMYYLGMSKREVKDNAAAKQALQSALNLKVNSELATEAQRALSELK